VLKPISREELVEIKIAEQALEQMVTGKYKIEMDGVDEKVEGLQRDQ
jgi:hypothetical protein